MVDAPRELSIKMSFRVVCSYKTISRATFLHIQICKIFKIQAISMWGISSNWHVTCFAFLFPTRIDGIFRISWSCINLPSWNLSQQLGFGCFFALVSSYRRSFLGRFYGVRFSFGAIRFLFCRFRLCANFSACTSGAPCISDVDVVAASFCALA